MYKLFIVPPSTEANSIIRLSDNVSIPLDPDNTDYQQFVDDIYEKGLGIVDGADYVGVTTYTEARKAEYPPLEEQLDKIYHSGIDAWKADIKVIKDKYPKQTMDATELQKRKDTATFNLQKRNYEKAVARLAQYELSAGLKDEDGKHIIMPIAVEINGERNPLVVADELERTEAQEVINNTPQAVIESVSS